MKNKITIFFAVQLLCLYASAQSNKLPTIVPASPEASSLAKYINYPVNHSSGLVDINIPLYEVKVGDLILPISLSYHASGIKVNQNSGIVGLGWTLNAEPSVSRSVQGLPDEDFYIGSAYSAPMDYKQEQIYKMNLAGNEMGVDEEPDEFYYKLLTKSGGFYISKKPRTTDVPKFVLHPYAPISIDNSNVATSITNAFNIIDDAGLRYNFSIKEATSGVIHGRAPITTCWKVNTITSPATAQVISFQYQQGNIERTHNNIDRVEVQDQLLNVSSTNMAAVPSLMGCTSYNGTPVPRLVEYLNGNYGYYKYLNNGQWVNGGCFAPSPSGSVPEIIPVHIKEINYSGGKVVFTMQLNSLYGDRLTNIKVYSGTELIKEFEFDYESGGGRSILQSITVLDKNGVSVEKHQFDYYGDLIGFPDFLSKAVDYWGYSNGANNDYSKSFVPLTTITTNSAPFGTSSSIQIGNANREPNFQKTLDLTLKKITYPTGGSTEFFYEPNQYRDGTEIKNTGGIRIRRVVSNSIEHLYKYGNQEDGTGLLRSSKAVVNDFSSEQTEEFFDYVLNYTYIFSCRKRTYYSNALTDLFYSGGCPVFYDFVTEYITDGGKIEYQYRSEGNGGYGSHYRFPNTNLTIDLKWEWKFGQLASKKVYKGNLATNSFDPVSSNDYTYHTINALDNSIYVGKTFRTKNLVNYPNQNSNPDSWAYQKQDGSFLYTSYNIPTGAVVLDSDTSTTYNGGNKLITVNEYKYDNAVLPSPTEIKTTSSEGVLITTKNKYPHDLSLTGNAETGRQKLITDFRVGTLLEQSKEKGTSITKTRTDYGIFNGKAQPASVITNTGLNFSDEQRIVFHGYDTNGNLLDVSKNGNDKVCYLWGYNKLYPVARIENATYAQVEALAGFGAGFTLAAGLSAAQEATLRTSLPNAMITTYTYNPFVGVTSITDPKGDTVSYTYDSFGRLQNVKDKNGNILTENEYHYKTP